MKINDKGFTLVEIIITIGIIGVVAVIAFPAILALQSSNEDTKYEAYTDLLGSNARIYVNSFEKDIFPKDSIDNSCFVLDYETMYNNDLIKDIEIPGVYCNNKSLQDVKTFVKITPDGAGYDYETSIYCYDGSGNMVYESEKKVDTTDCDVIDEDGPSIEIISDTDVSNISNIKYSDYRKEHDYTIKVSDKSGLVDNIEIRYGWGYDGNIPTTYITHSFNNNYGVNEVSFSSNTNDEALINDKNGKWKLYVEVVNVADTEGYSTTDGVSTSFGLDNTAPVTPVINNTNHNKWVNFDYSVTANSSDAGSGIAYYQYSYDGSKWTTYKNSAMNSFTTTKFTKERNQNVYIRACDRLGHCSLNGSSNIKIDKTKPSVPTSTVRYDNSLGTVRKNSDTSFTHRDLWWGNFNSTDNLSGVKISNGYQYSFGCSKIPNIKFLGTYHFYNFDMNSSVCIRSIDNANNYSDWSVPTYLKIDKTPDTPSIDNPTNGEWVNNDFYLTINASSAITVGYYQYSYDNKSWTTYNNSAKQSYKVLINEEQDEKIYIRACSLADSCSGSVSTNLKLDKTPPELEFGVKGGTYSSNWYEHTVYGGDADSGVKDVTFHMYRTPTIPGNFYYAETKSGDHVNIGMPVGSWDIHAAVVDKAGNRYPKDGWITYSYVINTPPPPTQMIWACREGQTNLYKDYHNMLLKGVLNSGIGVIAKNLNNGWWEITEGTYAGRYIQNKCITTESATSFCPYDQCRG